MADGLERTAIDPMTGRTGTASSAPRQSVSRAVDPSRDFLRNLRNVIVPVNVRQFVSHLAGNMSPITEDQFTPEDLAAIRYAILKQGGGASGSIGYGDYGASGWSSFGDPTEGPLDMLYKSYTDPAYRMETTLGTASYRRLPDGSYIVEDRYNFNAPSRQRVLNAVNEKGMLRLLDDAFRKSGLAGVLNVLGNVYGQTEDEPGAPVSIRIPPVTDKK